LYSVRNCIFGFQCTSNWDEMSHASSASDDTEVRFCSGCEKEVYQCATDEELTHNIQLNRCVAINRSVDDGEEMLLGFMTYAGPKIIKDDWIKTDFFSLASAFAVVNNPDIFKYNFGRFWNELNAIALKPKQTFRSTQTRPNRLTVLAVCCMTLP